MGLYKVSLKTKDAKKYIKIEKEGKTVYNFELEKKEDYYVNSDNKEKKVLVEGLD